MNYRSVDEAKRRMQEAGERLHEALMDRYLLPVIELMNKKLSDGKRINLLNSTAEAAGHLGISQVRVRSLCRAGIIGTRVGGVWLVTDEDIAHYQKTRRPPGRPLSTGARPEKNPVHKDREGNKSPTE